MARTTVPTQQVRDGGIARADLNVTTSGSAVVAKTLGDGTLTTTTQTGPDAGTGDVTVKIASGSANTVLRNSGTGVAGWGSIDVSASAAVSGTLTPGNGGIGNSHTPAAGEVLSGNSNGLQYKALGANTAASDKLLTSKGTGSAGQDPTWAGLDSSLAITSSTLGVVANTVNQKVRASSGGTLAGTRREVNLIAGSNVTISSADNSVNDRVDITINATNGGAGGTHALLDGLIVTDSVATTPVQGTLVVGTAANMWQGLPVGAAGSILVSTGTDAQYTNGVGGAGTVGSPHTTNCANITVGSGTAYTTGTAAPNFTVYNSLVTSTSTIIFGCEGANATSSSINYAANVKFNTKTTGQFGVQITKTGGGVVATTEKVIIHYMVIN